jgi:hypothetical protein
METTRETRLDHIGEDDEDEGEEEDAAGPPAAVPPPLAPLLPHLRRLTMKALWR